jgi:hypothetical protein
MHLPGDKFLPGALHIFLIVFKITEGVLPSGVGAIVGSAVGLVGDLVGSRVGDAVG